jgi:hypothetical protein
MIFQNSDLTLSKYKKTIDLPNLKYQSLPKQNINMKFIKKENYISTAPYLFGKKSGLSDSGFFSVYFIFFTSTLFMLFFSIGLLVFTSQSKDAFRKKCITDLVETQKHIISSEKKLLALNMPSTLLRIAKAAAYTALIITPPPADIAILVELEEIETAQEALDKTQIALIKATEVRANLELGNTLIEINQQNQKIKKSWFNFVNSYSSYVVTPPHIFKLPVRKDSWGGLAPNYELETDFESKQKLVLYWHNIFSVLESAQQLLNPKGFFGESLKIAYGLSCSVQPERKGDKWDLKINLDKP